MPSYSSISDTELQVNKPITSSLMTRMRDNPLAILEAMGWATTAKRAVSSEYAVTAASTQTFTHGLTSIANAYEIDVMLYLICKSSEGGYNTNDVVAFAPSGRDRNISTIITTSSVIVRIGSGGIILTNATTGADFSITAANWRLRIKVRG